METYKRQFIEFMVESGVLTFGDFTTKSGRKTPFFINTGNYRTGRQIARLGGFYAEAIVAGWGRDFDVLFGPAYKGIPLAVAACIALAASHGMNPAFCFNRKEKKDHGEGGSLVGHRLADGDRVLIIEDVTTAGTSIRETVPVLRASADISLAGLIVSVDRQEKGAGEKSALADIRESFSMPAAAIVTLDEIVSYLHNREISGTVVLNDDIRKRIDAYREQYGA
ncbi:MAG: orotate phosphoribosyltransferase [Chitinivibrionales bacterium]|nr:orotate phosphoribosyltransferase [Chitinivibrionales bacterium]MBD3396313.1 orotate phosphoribosyltransferase [Chitinivibrionales bacterium]